MAALTGIKRRIRSVRGTRQITKAMQLVSASKLRRAQAAALAPQAYSAAAGELLLRLSAQPSARLNPLFVKRPVKNALTILVAGDRGMAGAYNWSVLKILALHAKEGGVPHKVISIGRRAAAHVARLRDIEGVSSYDVDSGDAETAVAMPVLEEVMRMYLAGEVDAVHIIHTHFKSSVKQVVTVKQLLPIQAPDRKEAAEDEFEPDSLELLEFAANRLLEAEILQAVLDARASEHASRMVAMMNATSNAEELIDDLTLELNTVRQSGITQELAEISGGAEAIS